MEMTWIAIAASLAMGLGAACIFIFAVQRGWFRNIEEAKYQVFWSDPQPSGPRPVGPVNASKEAVDDSESETH